MTRSRVQPPKVYRAVTQITKALADKGVPKNGLNETEGYRFRSLDDLYAALSPLLVQYRLCMLPRVVDRTVSPVQSGTTSMVRVVVQAQFDLVCATDGSRHCVEVFGEAIDSSDKATAKAMSAAFKAATIQTFCIPVGGQADPDAARDVPEISGVEATPVQGWDQWTSDIIDLIEGCETWDAVEHVQRTYRSQLRALSNEKPERYKLVGSEVARKKSQLSQGRSAENGIDKGANRTPLISAHAHSMSSLLGGAHVA